MMLFTMGLFFLMLLIKMWFTS